MNTGEVDYRAAVVFYGGVSLAVYENGVAAAFYDACEQHGIFRPLLTLLGGTFSVDVIAGASAGGINGLLLAAALESGADFHQTADLWRKSGGLDKLLRGTGEAETTTSLLKGGYYINELRKAFAQLCTGSAPSSPKEIDVYVTGTDLTGQIEALSDATGATIDTKQHGLVFHLKHRTERARLGVVRREEEDDEATVSQADVLASVARITSSFPAAFPPFTVEELRWLNKKQQNHVQETLQHLAHVRSLSKAQENPPVARHALVDGGVLDNKPFEPVLNAIFHRLPSEHGCRVDRKVFYIEPDPERFKQATKFTPLLVAVKSLTLPMYDSISKDLHRLDRHNAKIRRFQALRQQAVRHLASDSPPSSEALFSYRQALQQSIGCMLLGIDPSDVDSAKRLDQIVPALSGLPEYNLPSRDTSKEDERTKLPEWNGDVAFHLRRAFHVLYSKDEHQQRRVQGESRFEIGRIIKALKMLRDIWVAEVGRLIEAEENAKRAEDRRYHRLFAELAPEAETNLKETAAARLSVLKRYLAGEWLDASSASELEDEAGTLKSEKLGELGKKARAWLRGALSTPAKDSASACLEPLVLDWLEKKLEETIRDSKRSQKILAHFESVDALIFPAEFAASLYELDVVEVTRIAPQDTKLLSRLDGQDKITGDTLAHFSAFLRRDWRTNDIAWGQADGICQIVSALLSETTWNRIVPSLQSRKKVLKKVFDHEALLSAILGRDTGKQGGAEKQKTIIPGLADQCATVERAFDTLLEHPENKEALANFKQALIHAGAIAAVGRYIPQIVDDTQWQNADWRWKNGPSRHPTSDANALQQLKDMALGRQPFHKELPVSLMLEYAGHAGLLAWGLVSTSFKARNLANSLTKRFGRVIVPILHFVHLLGLTLRTGEARIVLVLVGVCAVGYGLGAAFADSVGHAMIGFAVAFFMATFLYWLARSRLWTVVVTLALAALVALFFLPPGIALRTMLGDALVEAGEWFKP